MGERGGGGGGLSPAAGATRTHFTLLSILSHVLPSESYQALALLVVLWVRKNLECLPRKQDPKDGCSERLRGLRLLHTPKVQVPLTLHFNPIYSYDTVDLSHSMSSFNPIENHLQATVSWLMRLCPGPLCMFKAH